ncbi:MAG: hypothetical protein ACI82F_003576 [Planctomycetota bacterium]
MTTPYHLYNINDMTGEVMRTKTERNLPRSGVLSSLCLTVGFACSACSSDADHLGEAVNIIDDALVEHVVPAPGGSFLAGTGQELFYDNHFSQSYGIYGPNVSAGNVGLFWIMNREVDPVTGDEYQYVNTVSASFEIVDVVPRCANDFFVRGRYTASGTEVIERWQVRMPNGAWHALRPQSSEPVGVSVPGYNPPIESIVGDLGFIAPDDRPGLPTVIRTLVYRLPAGDYLTTLEPDPDGRFVLYSDGDIVHRMILGESQPSIVGSSTSLNLGVHSITRIGIYQNAAAGRHVVIDAGDYDYNALLLDAGNDGDFEGVLEMDTLTYNVDFGADDFDDLIF